MFPGLRAVFSTSPPTASSRHQYKYQPLNKIVLTEESFKMQFSTTFIVAAIAGLAASAPAVSEHVAVKRFAPGRCGVHVRQYQKNVRSKSTYDSLSRG